MGSFGGPGPAFLDNFGTIETHGAAKVGHQVGAWYPLPPPTRAMLLTHDAVPEFAFCVICEVAWHAVNAPLPWGWCVRSTRDRVRFLTAGNAELRAARESRLAAPALLPPETRRNGMGELFLVQAT
jgi:hypothetical protein